MILPSHKIFAIGDIHGCHAKLVALLQRLPADKDTDVLVFMGDYINRGPDSCKVLDTLLQMYRMGVARFGINLNSSIEIVRSVAALPGGAVEV